jgi:uncharacterized protein
MTKLILLLFLGLLAYLAFKGFRRSASSRPGPGNEAPAAERMVSCARCGVHLPESEAVAGDGARLFCSEEHRRLGPE